MGEQWCLVVLVVPFSWGGVCLVAIVASSVATTPQPAVASAPDNQRMVVDTPEDLARGAIDPTPLLPGVAKAASLDLELASDIRVSGVSGRASVVPISVSRPSRGLINTSGPDVFADFIQFDEAVLEFRGTSHRGALYLTHVEGMAQLSGEFDGLSLEVFWDGVADQADWVVTPTIAVGNDAVETPNEEGLPANGDIDEADERLVETNADLAEEPEAQVFRPGTSPNVMDVLFVYTANAQSPLSFTAFRGKLISQIVKANQAMTNTGEGVVFNIVGYEEVESIGNNSLQIINRIRDPSDGYADDIHLYRDLYGADIVIMVEKYAGQCGRAWLPQSTIFPTLNHNGFATIKELPGCGLVGAHELGHTFGAGHSTTELGHYSDSAGFTNGTNRTATSNQQGSSILWYSTRNPAIPHSGGPVGTTSRENDRAIARFDDHIDHNRYSNRDWVDISCVYGVFCGKGYRVTSQGRVSAFGGAPFLGDVDHITLNAPVVGIETDRDGHGYYLVAADGGVFAFGATYYGSAGGINLAAPIVDMATDSDGSGYWLAAADGGVFSYSATFQGSAGGISLSEPIVAMDSRNNGSGYWLLALDGGVFNYGANFYGSITSSAGDHRPARDIIATNSDQGYWIVSGPGEWRHFGTAASSPSANKDSWERNPGDLVTGADVGGPGGVNMMLIDRSGNRVAR